MARSCWISSDCLGPRNYPRRYSPHCSGRESTLEAFVHGALLRELQRSLLCFAILFRPFRQSRLLRPILPPAAFDLVDADGRIIVADRHLLSLRDMNRTSSLEEMMDAGVRSFKIEGRLKDVSYVKNVTAWYRRRNRQNNPSSSRNLSPCLVRHLATHFHPPMPRAVSTADSPTTFCMVAQQPLYIPLPPPRP